MLTAGLVAYLTLSIIIKSERTVAVPDLVDQHVVAALEQLSDLGLNTRVKGSRHSPAVSKNRILFQDPAPGTRIKAGRDVRIVLSKGPRIVQTPDLEGLALQQARILLTENGLCLGVISRTHSPMGSPHAIIAQSPPPGVEVPQGECVSLLISRGTLPIAWVMPDLSGLSLESAVERLAQLQMTIGKLTSAFRAGRPLNTVLDQEPPGGHRVLAGQSVDLAVNRRADAAPVRSLLQPAGARLFRHRLADGFLNRRVRVRLSGTQTLPYVFDDFVKPGQEIWLLIPGQHSAVFVYEDDELIKTRIFDMDAQSKD